MADYKTLIQKLVTTAVDEGASDLHISANRKPTLRVASALIPLVGETVLTPEDTRGLAEEFLGPENTRAFEEQKDLDFAWNFSPRGGGKSARFRGNVFFQQGNVGIALRYIPSKIQTLDELRLPPILKDFAFKKQGFFLVVGPVGQGKSTTLAAMVDLINQERAEHIITIEDPVEYIFSESKSIIDQREVRFDTKDFKTAMKAMFREDVNVALIGEMRDAETISTAVTAAETGHLILSTLHTNNASQTIDRIIDSFAGPQQGQIATQLAATLLGVFSQRLIPRISGGLIPAYELLINTSGTANLIRERRTSEINVLIETGSEQGMVDMNHSLAELVRKGEITTEEAIAHSLNPRVLEQLL